VHPENEEEAEPKGSCQYVAEVERIDFIDSYLHPRGSTAVRTGIPDPTD
jgi:hypothetical protein